MKTYTKIITITMACMLAAGCSAFRVFVSDKDPRDAKSLGGDYDARDLLSWTDEVAQKIVNHPFPPPGRKKPVVVALGIQNRTKTHLDTKALSDTIRNKLINSGKMDFINAGKRDERLKELQYQQQNSSLETRIKIGKELGAQYMLTGSLVDITSKSGREVRVSSKKDTFYQLTVEITDLETGLIVCTKQVERMRRVSKPIIGW